MVLNLILPQEVVEDEEMSDGLENDVDIESQRESKQHPL